MRMRPSETPFQRASRTPSSRSGGEQIHLMPSWRSSMASVNTR